MRARAKAGIVELLRLVREGPGLSPGKLPIAGFDEGDHRSFAQTIQVGQGFRRSIVRFDPQAKGVLFRFRDAFLDSDCFDGAGKRVVPIVDEEAIQIGQGVANYDSVKVDDESIGCVEVLVANVSTADDGVLSIDDHLLVVHASVDTAESGRRLQGAQGSDANRRIEKSDFDVWMSGGEGQISVLPAFGEIVHQESDANAAFGRVE